MGHKRHLGDLPCPRHAPLTSQADECGLSSSDCPSGCCSSRRTERHSRVTSCTLPSPTGAESLGQSWSMAPTKLKGSAGTGSLLSED